MRRMTSAGVTPSLRQAGDAVRLANQEAAKRNARAQQRAGEETALEIAPRIQHVLRTHAARPNPRDSPSPECMALCGEISAVAVVQDLVADEERQLVLQPLFLIAQALVDQHGAGRLESRAHQSARSACGASPSNQRTSKPWLLADCHHGIEGQRHLRACRTLRPRARCRENCCDAFPARPGSAAARIAARWCRFATAVPAARSAAVRARTGMPAPAAWLPGRRARAARGATSTSVFSSRNQRASLLKMPASMSSISAEGMRLPVSTMLR